MKVILFVCITIGAMADLIGFNRLGNNVKGHYEARFLRKSRSSYLKQLQGFMISNEAEKSQSNKIRELISDENARKDHKQAQFSLPVGQPASERIAEHGRMSRACSTQSLYLCLKCAHNIYTKQCGQVGYALLRV